jgi:hypothetical protein
LTSPKGVYKNADTLAGAGLTQLVECQLPKLKVAGSNPVSRSQKASVSTEAFLLARG